MKQTYISPETFIVQVAVHQHLLGNSITMSGSAASVSGGEYQTLSRRGHSSDWDDED